MPIQFIKKISLKRLQATAGFDQRYMLRFTVHSTVSVRKVEFLITSSVFVRYFERMTYLLSKSCRETFFHKSEAKFNLKPWNVWKLLPKRENSFLFDQCGKIQIMGPMSQALPIRKVEHFLYGEVNHIHINLNLIFLTDVKMGGGRSRTSFFNVFCDRAASSCAFLVKS